MPRPAYGSLYQLDYTETARRIRPATAAEREASDDTRYVNGTGIFAVLKDNTVVRRDAPNYPPNASIFARYRWANG